MTTSASAAPLTELVATLCNQTALLRGARIVSLTPLEQDASARRYFRAALTSSLPSLMVLVYGESPGPRFPQLGLPAQEYAMVELAKALPTLGLRIPQLYAHSPDAQVMLFEDCGDISFASALNQFAGVKDAHREQVKEAEAALNAKYGDAWTEALFKQAIEMIAAIQKIPASAQLITHRRWLPFENLRREANEFIQYVAEPRGATRAAMVAIGTALDGLCETMGSFPKAVTHFDFHAYNLMIRPDGELVVIDFQDMSLGSPARDVVSLLNDRGMDERLGPSLHSRLYQCAEQALGYEPAVFRGYYDTTLLHWDLRVSGRFNKLTLERGTDRYQQWIPGTLRRLGRTLMRSYRSIHGLEDVLEVATKLCPEVREGVEDPW